MPLSVRLRNLLIVTVAATLSAVFYVTDAHKAGIFYGDGMGYYMYLPATFIYHNLDTWVDLPRQQIPETQVLDYMKSFNQGGLRSKTGKLVNQYTYCIALMESPFFFAAHAYNKLRGLPVNGYNISYENAIRISSFVYGLLGLLLVYRILRRYHSSTVSLLCVTMIYLGSNLFWFMTYQGGMAHVPLFFLYAMLIWLTIRLYEQPARGTFLWIALIAGLITVARPTDIFCLLIPLLYGVYDKATFEDRIAFLRRHRWQILTAAFVFLLPALPQMAYWKMVSGQYLYYSYGQQTFHWRHPEIVNGLFGGRNGWLMYSPLMAFSLAGIACYRTIRPWFWCIVLLFPVYVYIIYAWYCYNYINGLGSRPMIHLYPLLAIPFAAVLRFVAARRHSVIAAFSTLSVLFIAVNISYSMQQSRGILNSEESNLAYNLGMMFRMHLSYDDLVVKDIGEWQPDPRRLTLLRTLAYDGYEDSVSVNYVRDRMHGRGFIYSMGTDENYPRALRIPYDPALFRGAKWFKCSGRFMFAEHANFYDNHLLILDVKRNGQYPLWKGCRIENKVGLGDSSCGHTGYLLSHSDPGLWGRVQFYVQIPCDLRKGDLIELDLWNVAKKPLFMDDLLLQLYR